MSAALTRLEGQRAAIRECIEANAACMALYPDSGPFLAQQNHLLWAYYARVTGAIREARAGWTAPADALGRNGHGPAIDTIIRMSRSHRERACQERKAA